MPALSTLDARLRRWRWAILAGILAVLAGAGAGMVLTLRDDPPPHGRIPGFSCDLGLDGAVELVLKEDGRETRLGRDAQGRLFVDGRPCGAASVSNVEVILVRGGDGDQAVIVDLSAGPLAPGRSDEPVGRPEIEIRVDLGEGRDGVRVVGGGGVDRFAAAGEGIHLDRDEEEADIDVTLAEVEDVVLVGGGGDDELSVEPDGPAVRLEGSAGADVLAGGPGDDVLLGGDGDDVLVASAGTDRFLGGDGDDLADFSSAVRALEADLVEGRISTAEGEHAIEEIEGVRAGAGDDRLRGNAEDNLLEGGQGADVLLGGQGDDTFDGGPGADRVDFTRASGPIMADLEAGLAEGEGSDTLAEIERITGGSGDDELAGDGDRNVLEGGSGDDLLGGGGGADRLAGGPGDDRITGGADGDTILGDEGADVLVGGPGDDRLAGGAGADRLTGSAGTDLADFAGERAGVAVDLGAGTARDATGDIDLLEGIEDVRGGPGDDALTGGDLPNRLEGGPGSDILAGGGADDVLVGGPGDDELQGGPGDDTLDGADGVDRVSYARAPRPTVVDLAAGVAFADGEGGNDSLLGTESVLGSPQGDAITGDAGPNVLDGGGGDDALRGAGGADRLAGGEGDDRLEGRGGGDVLDGGTGIDVALYQRAGGGVVLNLGVGRADDDGDGAADTLAGIERVEGSAFDDRISGDDAPNTIAGMGGNDEIFGAGGDDLLLGGPGNDAFRGGSGIDECRGEEGVDSFEECEVPLQ